jgi:aminobenzoyl-glutamate utilization protein B
LERVFILLKIDEVLMMSQVKMEKEVERISQLIEEKSVQLIQVSNCIWEYAETGLEEWKSAELLCETLEKRRV